MYLLGGARHLSMDADLDFRLGPFSEKYSDSGHVLDGIVGLRGRSELNANWYVNYHVDVGAGDSDLVRTMLAGLNYRFEQVSLRSRERFWDIPVPKIDSIFDSQLGSGRPASVAMRYAPLVRIA